MIQAFCDFDVSIVPKSTQILISTSQEKILESNATVQVGLINPIFFRKLYFQWLKLIQLLLNKNGLFFKCLLVLWSLMTIKI